MSDPPSSEPATEGAPTGEPAAVDLSEDEAPELAPRVVLRVWDPEAPTSWTAGPVSTRTAKQTGAQVSCGISFLARRAELAEFTKAGGERKGSRDEQILGGPMPARRRPAPVARVSVRAETDED